MTLSVFFLVCFVFGFVLSAIAFLSGSAHVHFHGFHAGHGHAGGHGKGGASKINFGTIAAFTLWFGGTGCMLIRLSGVGLVVAVAASTLAGFAGAILIWLFIARVLMPGDKPLDSADYEMPGSIGRVSSPVRPNGTGEMIFVQQGRRQGVPIRSENGKPLATGTEVVVTRYERGIAYVREWEEFTA